MSSYAHPELLVDTQWLMEHLDDPTVRILEVDMSPDRYKDAHIPGALFWNVFVDLLLPDLRINLDPMAMAQLLSRSGITPETTVVAYGSYPGTGAWIFWLLRLFGHDKVLVLNGGHQKWMAEGRPVVAALSSFSAIDYPVKAIDASLRVLMPEVRDSLARADRILLDVRSLPEYLGEIFLMKPPEGSERGGHIPGAVHIENLLTLNEDGTFKSAAELQALYQNQGVTPDKEVLTYCAIGARAGSIWFLLKYLLGYPHVRNYDGSWNEWSRIADAPIREYPSYGIEQ
jgi:thiosulfate/3-mercaptopyruvate sulfurtransferase